VPSVIGGKSSSWFAASFRATRGRISLFVVGALILLVIAAAYACGFRQGRKPAGSAAHTRSSVEGPEDEAPTPEGAPSEDTDPEIQMPSPSQDAADQTKSPSEMELSKLPSKAARGKQQEKRKVQEPRMSLSSTRMETKLGTAI
jgi:hypothetical protein